MCASVFSPASLGRLNMGCLVHLVRLYILLESFSTFADRVPYRTRLSVPSSVTGPFDFPVIPELCDESMMG